MERQTHKFLAVLIIGVATCSTLYARGGHGGSHHTTHVPKTTYAPEPQTPKTTTTGTTNPKIVHVHGYVKKDGTYVAPHDRTAPNNMRNDNWSTRGNVNPETGKAGTKPRDEDINPPQLQPPGKER
jgi:hypothetical protein